MRYIEVLEAKLGRKAVINGLPVQPGEMVRTEAGLAQTEAVLGYRPRVSIDEGVGRFVDWYRGYYGV